MTITRESVVLIAICAFDLVSTLLFINTQKASEGNPLMAFYLKYGIGTFILMKLALVLLPIFVAEWSKQYRPRFVRFMLRAAIVSYVGIYLALFLTVNVGAQQTARHITAPPAGSVQSLDRP
jgi:hypothetical protein